MNAVVDSAAPWLLKSDASNHSSCLYCFATLREINTTSHLWMVEWIRPNLWKKIKKWWQETAPALKQETALESVTGIHQNFFSFLFPILRVKKTKQNRQIPNRAVGLLCVYVNLSKQTSVMAPWAVSSFISSWRERCFCRLSSVLKQTFIFSRLCHFYLVYIPLLTFSVWQHNISVVQLLLRMKLFQLVVLQNWHLFGLT